MWYDDITEAHEAITSQNWQETLLAKIRQYRAGEETREVVAMYERAAHDMGVPISEIEALWEEA